MDQFCNLGRKINSEYKSNQEIKSRYTQASLFLTSREVYTGISLLHKKRDKLTQKINPNIQKSLLKELVTLPCFMAVKQTQYVQRSREELTLSEKEDKKRRHFQEKNRDKIQSMEAQVRNGLKNYELPE